MICEDVIDACYILKKKKTFSKYVAGIINLIKLLPTCYEKDKTANWKLFLGGRCVCRLFWKVIKIFTCTHPHRSGVGEIDKPYLFEQVFDTYYAPEASEKLFTKNLSIFRSQKCLFFSISKASTSSLLTATFTNGGCSDNALQKCASRYPTIFDEEKGHTFPETLFASTLYVQWCAGKVYFLIPNLIFLEYFFMSMS